MKFNLSLFLACIFGGVVGFILAEVFYSLCKDTWYTIPLVGLYIAIVSFFIALFGAISEYNTNHISRRAWDSGVLNRTLGLLVLLSFIGVFAAGSLLQFIYGIGKVKQVSSNVDDYIVMIDNSGSTSATDPYNERFASIVDFISGMKDSQRIMISLFDDTNQIVLPLTQKSDGLEIQVQDILSQYTAGNGTNIEAALTDSLNNYTPGGKQALAILFSDGECPVDINTMSQLYADSNIALFTVGYKDQSREGKAMLEKLAYKTGGNYYEISGVNSLKQTYGKIVHYTAKRNLLDYRIVNEQSTPLYIFLRIVFILLIVFLFGLIIGLVLDSSELLTGNRILRILSGGLAGLVLEIGLMNSLPDIPLRFIMCILMSLVISRYRPITYENIYIPTYERKTDTPEYITSNKDNGTQRRRTNEFSTDSLHNHNSNQKTRNIPKYK